MTTSIITPQIVEFAQSVRAALSDLPVEERDELTDGLEADLAEAYAEDSAGSRGAGSRGAGSRGAGSRERHELPDPGEYATELRNAAGLPKIETTSDAGMLASVSLTGRRAKADLAASIRGSAALSSVADFLVSIRPLWWVARAWVAAWLVVAVFGLEASFLPASATTWLLLLVFVVISVQWGRGAWRFAGLGPIIVIGNVIAAVLLVPVVAMADDWTSEVNYGYADGGPGDLTGVYLDGSQVTNVFPYDAQGKPLDDVQLFTQDGQPLRATVDGADGCIDPDCTATGLWVPRVLSNGLTARNVFPMSMAPVSTTATDGLQPDPDAVVEPRPLPFATAPKVLAPEKVQTSEKVAPDNE